MAKKHLVLQRVTRNNLRIQNILYFGTFCYGTYLHFLCFIPHPSKMFDYIPKKGLLAEIFNRQLTELKWTEGTE